MLIKIDSIIKGLIYCIIFSLFHQNLRIGLQGPVFITEPGVLAGLPFLYEVFLFGAVGLQVLSALIKPKIKCSKVPDYLLLLFIFLVFISYIRKSDSIIMHGQLRVFIEFMLIFFISSKLVWSNKEGYTLCLIFVITVFISALGVLISLSSASASLQFLFFNPIAVNLEHSEIVNLRVMGFWHTVNMLATFLAMGGIAGISLFFNNLSSKKTAKRGFILLGFGMIIFLGLLMTLSRTGFIGYTAGLLYLWFRIKSRRTTITFVILTICIIAVITTGGIGSGMKNRLLEAYSGDEARASRIQQHKAGLIIALNYPLLGIGLNNFLKVSEDMEIGVEGGISEIHNVFLMLACFAGIPALIIYLTIIIKSFIIKSFDSNKPIGNNNYRKYLNLTIRSIIVVYLACGLTELLFFFPHVSIIFWIFLGFLASPQKPEPCNFFIAKPVLSGTTR